MPTEDQETPGPSSSPPPERPVFSRAPRGEPFSAGRTLALSASMVFSNAGAFVLLTALVQAPVLAYHVHLIASRAVLDEHPRELGLLLGAGMLLQPLATAAVTWGVLQQLRGKPVTFAACLRAGLSRVMSVIGVSLVSSLIALAGMMMLCLPGFYAMTVFFVATPVAVIEGLGIRDSLRRSHELTEGSRWGVFHLFTVLLFLGLSIMSLGGVHADKADGRNFQILNLVLSVVMQAFTAVAEAVAYHGLRVQREGGGADFAGAFD